MLKEATGIGYFNKERIGSTAKSDDGDLSISETLKQSTATTLLYLANFI